MVPVAGFLEEPDLVAHRAGEGAVHVAEELALEERLGQGGAVHLHEGLPRARAQSDAAPSR